MLSSFFTSWCHPSDFKHLPGIWLPLRNKTHIGLSKCGSTSLRMIQQQTNPIHKSSLALDPEAVVDAPILAEGMKWSNWCFCADNVSVPSLLSQNCLKLPVLVAEIQSGFSKYYLMMTMTKKSGGFWNYDWWWWLHLLLNLVILNTLQQWICCWIGWSWTLFGDESGCWILVILQTIWWWSWCQWWWSWREMLCRWIWCQIKCWIRQFWKLWCRIWQSWSSL